MNQKKLLNGVIILVIFIITAVILYLSKYYINGTEEGNKIFGNKDLVYTIYTEEEFGSNIKIPYINLKGNYAKEINNILKTTKKDIENSKESDVKYDKFSYEYYINDNILSLIITKIQDIGFDISYDIYNINIYTGEKIDNLSLIEYKELTIDDWEKELFKAIDNYYDSKVYISLVKCKKDFGCNEAYNKTLSYYKVEDKNELLINMPMFLDSKGNINIVGKVCLHTEVGDYIVYNTYDKIITFLAEETPEYIAANKLVSYVGAVEYFNLKSTLKGEEIITDINVIHQQLEDEEKSLVTNLGKVVIDKKSAVIESISGAIVDGFTCNYTFQDGAICTK